MTQKVEPAERNTQILDDLKAAIAALMEKAANDVNSWEAPKGEQFKQNIDIVNEMVDEAFHGVISEARKILEEEGDRDYREYVSDNRTHLGNC